MTVSRLVFVTGLSGAGKSQAMKTLEDLGFYCVDNLPPKLVSQTLALLRDAQVREIAIALDVRSGGALGEALPLLEQIAAEESQPQVLFLDARDDVLVRRYSETRRRHPFAWSDPCAKPSPSSAQLGAPSGARFPRDRHDDAHAG